MVELPGYQTLEPIYTSTRSLVYRGRRCSDGQLVIIKLLRNEYPSFSELIQFRNQYSITQSLNLPHVVQPQSLETYHNGYALVLEDYGGISLKQWMDNQQQGGRAYTIHLRDFFAIALQLSETLNALYQHRIIHKDIKPSNILIHPGTQHIKLTDFSLSSRLPRETQSLQTFNALEGTLAYLSPEQTGRMNRGIDYRTDLYSLGVTFYELLTGQLPFTSDDPMELIHCHLAKAPTPPHQLNPAIPPVLSAIVLKLMAKNAEDRYQSALGLQHDLQRCQRYWQTQGTIPDFPLGQRDICDRFLIPEKLYGREAEVAQLLAAFARVAGVADDTTVDSEAEPDNARIPQSELVLVAGYSGVGKTAVVNEVQKPIAQQRGYFIKGKFDQFNRNIPFSAFVQAFRDLMEQLLGESDAALNSWKTKILAAVGENGQVIVDVIPELERMIGPQPAVADLSGAAAQNRFNLLFQQFIQVFTTSDHPLVIFLDDLQWADSASLKLMQRLVAESATGYLLLIGAYRDNEVSAAHPLVSTINSIRQTHLHPTTIPVHTITLKPLSSTSLNQLIADTLHCSLAVAQPFSALVYQKTTGNPFFSTQFLKALYEDGLISFNTALGYWQCDLAQIKTLALTDDVVEFMALQLQKLPSQAQATLKRAACIGNQFDLATLAIVCEQSVRQTAVSLWQALQEGFILPQNEVYKFFSADGNTVDPVELAECQAKSAIRDAATAAASSTLYKFLHDRIQQAAYSLIPEAERAIAHYQIGQLLLHRLSPTAKEERIFELVNQLNYGVSLITEQSQRDELAQLNLRAGRKARAATAYEAAYAYVQVGLSVLSDDTWQRQYELTLALYELAAEVASLNGEFEQMDRWIETIVQQAKTPLDQVPSYQVKIQSLNTRNAFTTAIETGLAVLQQLGISFPEQPTPNDVQQAKQDIERLICDRTSVQYSTQSADQTTPDYIASLIPDLLHLPKATDATTLAILQIADSISPACYMTGSPLYPLVVALQVKLSIQFGNSPSSPVGYVGYAFQLYLSGEESAQAQQFGQLAYQLALDPEAKYVRASTFNIFAGYIHHRTAHLKESLPIFQDAFQAGLDTGNLEFIVYIVQVFALNAFWSGQSLAELATQIQNYHQHLLDLKRDTTAKHYFIYWETARILLGESEEEICLRQISYENTLLSEVKLSHDALRLCIFYLHRLVLNFLLGNIDQATYDAVQTRQHLNSCVGMIIEPNFYFYDSLIILSSNTEFVLESHPAWQQILDNQLQLQQWVKQAPMNHQHKWQLIEAERYRILKQYESAIDCYDKAIQAAKTNGYISDEALANELAAKFYLNWGKDCIAVDYLHSAYYSYARWGAKAKTDSLEQQYSQLLQPAFTLFMANSTHLNGQVNISQNCWNPLADEIVDSI
ncbi:MAG: ATP-binding protein [Thainema sp.]